MNTRRFGIISFVTLWAATLAFAQSDMRGHWTGLVVTPGGSLGMEVDLDKTADGWIGSLSIPDRGATGLPLDKITFADGKGAFQIKDAPGAPSFAGTLSADGRTWDGDFSQGGMSLPLKFTRNGEAKVVVPKPSPPVGAEFVGKWEGLIEGQGLHLVLTLANGKTAVEAALFSPDQGNAQVPVTAVSQLGTKLLVLASAVNASYSGDINKEGTEIAGTFTQAGMPFPLTLKKSASAK